MQYNLLATGHTGTDRPCHKLSSSSQTELLSWSDPSRLGSPEETLKHYNYDFDTQVRSLQQTADVVSSTGRSPNITHISWREPPSATYRHRHRREPPQEAG